MTATRDKMIQAIEYVVKPLSVGGCENFWCFKDWEKRGN